jgi:streptogramin lyase
MNARVLLLSIVIAGGAAAAPISNITFTSFPLGDPPVYTTTALAADPSGTKVWFTDQAFVQIGFIELSTAAVTKFSIRPPDGDTVLVLAGPQTLVFGADGSLWFPATFGFGTATESSKIGRFDPATMTVTWFPVAGSPFLTETRMAAGPDGNVWFTYQGEAKLGTITPQGAVSSIAVATAGGAFPGIMKGLAFGADGNAWVTAGFRSVFRVPPSGGAATEFRLEGGSFRSPSGITRGPDDSLYFVESGTSADMGNRIGRITTAGTITEWEIPTANSTPTGIATGSDGRIYFTEQSARQLGQLDPATGVILESPVPDGGIPLAIVAMPQGPATPAAAPRAHANASSKTGLVFNSFPSNFRDARPIYAVIDPGDQRPDPKALVSVVELPLLSDPETFFETFRIGSIFFVMLAAENVAESAPTFGPITMRSRVPDFVSEVTAGFVAAPGSCKAEDRVVSCTTTQVLPPGEIVSAGVTFRVPRPPAGDEMFSFEIFNSIEGGGDVNDRNNIAGKTLRFIVDRDAGVLYKLPETLGPAILSGRQ